MNKPSHGVIVGRFQVNNLHDGHINLIQAVRARHDRVIIFIGVAPSGLTRQNPLDYQSRRLMINGLFPDVMCYPLPDRRTDEEWSKALDEAIEGFGSWGEVTLYGGRDSFAPHYHGRHEVIELAVEGTTSGSVIRQALTNHVLDSSDFRAGVIHAVNNIRPRVVTCVDVIIMANLPEIIGTGVFTLLGQKPGENLWRFVGGHAEPTTESFEADAKREAYEETGCDINSIQYIGSTRIDDWRWPGEDKIKTLVFVGWTGQTQPRANDDISNVTWVHPFSVTAEMIVPAHQPIFKIYSQWRDKWKEVKA